MTDKYDAELGWWVREAGRRGVEVMYAEWADYYSSHLNIRPEYNCGRLLDIGCGPALPARHLLYDELWCVDPLFERYVQAGFCITGFNVVLVPFYAENLWGIPDDFFDTVVSVNALDHVDDFEAAIGEIERVAKPGALIRIRLHYHTPTPTEPMELSDERVEAAFSQFPVRALMPLSDSSQTLWGTEHDLT